jgi:large subunit ribosomal protein L23
VSNEVFRVIRQPFITEKSTLLKDDANVICLEVAIDATKADVKRAVEQVFKVKVESVNMLRLKGKVKRRGRLEGKRPDRKKAFVRLKEGESPPEFFEST